MTTFLCFCLFCSLNVTYFVIRSLRAVLLLLQADRRVSGWPSTLWGFSMAAGSFCSGQILIPVQRGSWAQTEQQKLGVSSNGQVCFERPQRHEIRSAVQCMWWKTLLVSAGWDCAKLIQVCLVPLGSCLFIFMNMCIYELSLHSLSQHATFPPLSMLHIITTPQLRSKHFSSFWVYLFIVYWWIWLKGSVWYWDNVLNKSECLKIH